MKAEWKQSEYCEQTWTWETPFGNYFVDRQYGTWIERTESDHQGFLIMRSFYAGKPRPMSTLKKAAERDAQSRYKEVLNFFKEGE